MVSLIIFSPTDLSFSNHTRRSYTVIISISLFPAGWIRREWGIDRLTSWPLLSCDRSSFFPHSLVLSLREGSVRDRKEGMTGRERLMSQKWLRSEKGTRRVTLSALILIILLAFMSVFLLSLQSFTFRKYYLYTFISLDISLILLTLVPNKGWSISKTWMEGWR